MSIREQLREDIARAIVVNGEMQDEIADGRNGDWAVRDDHRAFPWVEQREAQLHLFPLRGTSADACTITTFGKVTEESRTRILDTEGDPTELHTLEVIGCGCACGKYTGLVFTWEATFTDALRMILLED